MQEEQQDRRNWIDKDGERSELENTFEFSSSFLPLFFF